MNPKQQSNKIDPRNFDDLSSIVTSIKSQSGDKTAHSDIGIVCDSEFESIGNLIENQAILPYSKIPGFPASKIENGTEGNLIFGILRDKKVVLLQGRFHPYEHGMDLALCSLPVRVMHQLGIKILIIFDTARGINDKLKKGDLMLIKDHIFLPGLGGFSPLIGLEDQKYGLPFVPMHDAYDKDLRNLAMKIGHRFDMFLNEGIFCMIGGPQFETSAEIALLRKFGADAVGMSTCHEVTVARHCGLWVLGFSLITKVGNLDSEALDVPKMVMEKVSKLVTEIVKEIDL